MSEPEPPDLIRRIDRAVQAYERATGRVARRLYIGAPLLAQLLHALPPSAFREDAFGAVYYRGLRIVEVLPEEILDIA